ncbi:ABC transporter ATP-binding protein [Haloplanus rubicundus]|uniref:ABC-type D-xylose/L-arabinose transporter n=1 Tax=Haloplanus rubicundus TaxID=1547898 RepID=A0A345E1W4_9EURY|nr:ABC transporter ATP-binding protein [Haloplanus rubicundus]AXG06186.1 ABC transporter ATP-binding protein [Haloplanus rubicundus]
MAHLEVDNIRKVFDTPDGKEVAVEGVSFEADDGEFVTLVGPSGCGKTTTLRCIAGLETPTSGKIRLDGRDITELPPNKRDISLMFQSIALYPHMTVRENIAYPLKVDGVSKEKRNGPATEAAQTMQIEDMLDKMPGDLSGGQQQRAALARTVVQDPGVFLMDEPLSDLDAKLKAETRKEIQRIHEKLNTPVVYVTHDQEEAMTMSDYIAVMNDGEIEQFDSPNDIFYRPNNLFVGQFIGQHGMNVAEAEVVRSDSDVSVAVDGYEPDLRLENPENLSEGQVTLGFRPENTLLETDATEGIPGVVELIETFGEEAVVTVDIDRSEPLLAVIDSNRDLSEGADVRAQIGRYAHVFDEETGDVLTHTMRGRKQPAD